MKCTICNEVIDGEIRREDFNIVQEMYPEEYTKEFYKNLHVCKDCANKEREKKRIEQFKPVFEQVFKHVNCNSTRQHDLDAIVKLLNHEHRFLQNEFMMMVRRTLFTYGEGSGNPAYEDPRNGWALAWAKAAASIDVHLDQATNKYVAEYRPA